MIADAPDGTGGVQSNCTVEELVIDHDDEGEATELKVSTEEGRGSHGDGEVPGEVPDGATAEARREFVVAVPSKRRAFSSFAAAVSKTEGYQRGRRCRRS